MSFANLVANSTLLSSATVASNDTGFAIAVGNIRLVGSPARTLISTNSGSTFSNLTLPTNGRFYGMAYHDGYYVAAGANTASNSATVWYSNNTSTWTEVTNYTSQNPELRANAAFTWTTYNGERFVVGGPGVRSYQNFPTGNLTPWLDSYSVSNSDRTFLPAQIVAATWGGNGRVMMGAVGNGTTSTSALMYAIKSNNAFQAASLNSNWYGSATPYADFTTDVIYSTADDRFILTANTGTIVTHNWTSNTSIVGSSNTSLYVTPEADALPGGSFSNRGYRVQDNVSVYTTNIPYNLNTITEYNDMYYVANAVESKLYYSPTIDGVWQSLPSGIPSPIAKLKTVGSELYAITNVGELYSVSIAPDTPNDITLPSNVQIISNAAIETGLFCRIQCDYYKTSPSATPTTATLTFSNYNLPVYINSELYQPLGQLLGVTSSTSELRNSSQGITVTISGIPNTSIAEVVNSRFKGSDIEVWRIIFDAETKAQLAVTGRFQGLVNNYALEEDYDNPSGSASNRIAFTCSSTTEILSNKVSGRRTNPIDQKELYPTDPSMDRVVSLANSNFNFGAVIQ